jgi:hypothetical protein
VDKNNLIENLYNKLIELQQKLKLIDDRNLGAYSKSEDLYKFFEILDDAVKEIENIFIIENETK